MPTATYPARHRLCAASIILGLLVPTGQASVRAASPADFTTRGLTCEFPVRLTHDCSIWQGATRPIAFGDYRMTLAADRNGRTILITQLRPAPSHNGQAFRDSAAAQAKGYSSIDAIRRIGAALEDKGIRLERMQPVRQGRRIDAYFLEFSDNAYDFLKAFTVLESEHWLPRRRDLR